MCIRDRLSCTPVPGLISEGGDCNDSDAAVNPLGTETCNGLDDDCDGMVDEDCVLVAVKAFLEGPYNPATGLMRDGLRAMGLVPTTEPYGGLGYVHVGGGGATTPPVVLATSGPDAIVDWVVLELRDKNDNTSVLHSRSALLQADGDVVDMDGSSPVDFPLGPDDYYIALRHRNHLAVMTQNSLNLSGSSTVIDLTDGSTATYGTSAQQVVASVYVLWAGDVTFDGDIKYTGAGNDRDPILQAIGGSLATNTVSGYLPSDLNMDGTVKYTGAGNDRDVILVNIGGTVATNVRTDQLP